MSKFDLGEKLTGIKHDILIGQNLYELIRSIYPGRQNLLDIHDMVAAIITGFTVSSFEQHQLLISSNDFSSLIWAIIFDSSCSLCADQIRLLVCDGIG